MVKLSDIDKATRDKPVWFELDPDKRSILVVWNRALDAVIKTRGWTLNEVIALMEWKPGDIVAIFKRPWSKDRGAYAMTVHHQPDLDLSKLNEQGE